MTTSLQDRIRDRTCRYGVIGLGYVGLPLALAFARRGVSVVGLDLDATKVADLEAGRSYLTDVDHAAVAEALRSGRFEATTDEARLADVDVLSICVPTPLSKSRDPDLSFVEAALRSVEAVLRPGQLVILESTTYPGTTEEVLRPRLEQGGLVAGRDFWLAFSPERVDPGNQVYRIENTPKVVGGVDPESTRIAAAFYALAIDHVHAVESASAAEMVKLLENTFRSVTIALVNEVAIMCDRLGLDVSDVVGAAATKPFGFMRFDPGPGIGGHCIPLDPMYLSWKLRTLDYRARFIELAQDVNTGMPRYLVERVTRALNDHARSVRDARVLVMGVAYKRDVSDTRESPALEVIRLLAEQGADVEVADPWVDAVEVAGTRYATVEPTTERIAAADCVVVATDHTDLPWSDVAAFARLTIDARGVVPRENLRGRLLRLSGPAIQGRPAPVDRPAPGSVEAAR